TQDITTISQAVPVLINTLEDLVTVIVIYLYIAIVSIEAFIVIVFFIGVTIVYFYSGYFKIKNEMIKATIKETQFFGILKGVLKGFKQIKMNSKKNDDLFLDIDQVSKKSEAYKVQSLLTFREHSMNILSLYLVMYGTLLFILPIYVEDVRLNILKIFSALLFAAGPFEMVFRSIATIAMTNVAVDNLRRLEDKLDQTEKTDLDPLDLQTDFKQITLSDVRFNYTDKDGNITFQSGPIDLTVQKGEILFIVGGNGSGKSTLLKLLTGIYKPLPPGQILLDNTPVIQQTYPSYRELFSIIFTDYYLFKKIYG
ncbi:cyclic peptide transporter, partial [Candidatus Magnetomorum sp. HK-1]